MRDRKRIPLKGGDEYDALTGWRKYLKVFDKPKIAKKTKRKYNKRFRKVGKEEINKTIDKKEKGCHNDI